MSNKKSKGQQYAVSTYENGNWMSKNMALLGALILFFLCVHMGDFWVKVRFQNVLEMVSYPEIDHEIKNIYLRVKIAFENIWIVLIYLVGLLALALHLLHGFQSAFTSLGLQHKKYTPGIKILGLLYSILIPLAFAAIPLYMYFSKLSNY
jgi:succinate dehydrogenase / fumarate reductase cytochrome b subunit